MRKTDSFRQYIWLVNTIRCSRRISFERINKLWIENDMNDRRPLSRTTFYRLRQAIDEMFGILIECDASNGHQYYIANEETLQENTTQNWMLRTLTVNNILLDGLSIKERIVLEDIPAGLEYLETIIRAMKNAHKLSMSYKRFDITEGYTILIEPYCLKVFRQRWYLLGKSPEKGQQLQIYALDRITELNETGTTFDMDDSFDAKQFFKDNFGVFIGDNERPQRIVLRAFNKMIPLLRTLPLHHSQQEIATTASYSDFEYYLTPSFDFRQAVLKEGNELVVIEPVALRQQIEDTLMSALERYQSAKTHQPSPI